MNTSIELPSGKILNIARFIALLPVSNTNSNSYNLILEGCPAPISLEPRDADALKQLLQINSEKEVNHHKSKYEPDEQLRQNQKAIALLAKRMERNQKISQSESLQKEQLFEDFKQTIDAQRLPGQKLYSQL